MKNNVWILNHYATSMLFSKGGRHYWFAKYLKSEGYEPVIFCCNTKHGEFENYYDEDKLWVEKVAENINVPFVVIKSSLYKGNGKDRVLNMIRFYRNVQKAAKEYAKAHPKPDVIYASSIHPLTLVAGIQLAKHFGVKCICEIRDLWPESLVVYNVVGRQNPITKLLYLGEKWIYRKADAIIFTFEGGYDYIKEQNWQKGIPKTKVHYINNGVDLAQFDYNKVNFTLQDEDLENKELFKVVYTGSIRHVNNLGKLLDVAKLVKNPHIKFLIWGDGDELPKLKERIKKENIFNVVFKGRVDKKFVPFVTSKANLNFVHNESSPLFRFGISFNKIFDYLASGKPILCDFYAKYNPVLSFGAGVSVDSGYVKDIANMVDEIANTSEKILAVYGQNARNGAQEYDFNNLTKELISVIKHV